MEVTRTSVGDCHQRRQAISSAVGDNAYPTAHAHDGNAILRTTCSTWNSRAPVSPRWGLRRLKSPGASPNYSRSRTRACKSLKTGRGKTPAGVFAAPQAPALRAGRACPGRAVERFRVCVSNRFLRACTRSTARSGQAGRQRLLHADQDQTVGVCRRFSTSKTEVGSHIHE